MALMMTEVAWVRDNMTLETGRVYEYQVQGPSPTDEAFIANFGGHYKTVGESLGPKKALPPNGPATTLPPQKRLLPWQIMDNVGVPEVLSSRRYFTPAGARRRSRKCVSNFPATNAGSAKMRLCNGIVVLIP